MAAVLLLAAPWSIAAANNEDDGFIWIDANTRIKVKPVATTTAGGGATAPEKAPKKEDEKKDKAKK